MNCDFEVLISDVIDGKVLMLELGIAPNGNSVYRVAMFNGKKWSAVRYYNFQTAHATYKFLLNVI